MSKMGISCGRLTNDFAPGPTNQQKQVHRMSTRRAPARHASALNRLRVSEKNGGFRRDGMGRTTADEGRAGPITHLDPEEADPRPIHPYLRLRAKRDIWTR